MGKQSMRGKAAVQKKESVIKTSGAERLSMRTRLLILFFTSFAVHTILNILVNEGPTVVIDEGLYTNIARSLAWDGELAFRGQPVNYPYLLYPFLLVPVYWLNRILGGDVYRYIQVFNTLLITSSVFPAYLFSRDYTKDEKKAFTVALIVALMPDMIMGGYLMTECILWPLALWMIVFSYRFFSGAGLKYGLLTALFAGLMFAAKPGAIAVGAVLLALGVIRSAESRKNIIHSLLPVCLLVFIIGLVYVIYRLFFSAPDSILGLYTKQTSEWKPGDILVALEAVFLLIFLFVFACGGIYGILPFARLKTYDGEKRRFVLSVAFGILAAIIGTAVFVVPYKWDGSLGALPLHLRYCAMYVPVMIVFAIDRDLAGEIKSNKGFVLALLIFIVLSVFPGARAGFVKGETGTVDSVTLGAFIQNRNLDGTVTGSILTACVIVFMLMFYYTVTGRKTLSKTRQNLFSTAGIIYLAGFMLFNSVCAHIAANVYIDPTISRDALEVNETVGDRRCLGVTQRYYDDIYSYWLDSHLNVPMQQVTIDQMFVQMEETKGVYRPFVPVVQAPNINNHETPETDTFVLGMTIAEHLELSDRTAAVRTKHGHFTVVNIEPGARWVDTMMFGLDDNKLYDGNTGYLHVFSDDRTIDGNLYLKLTASGSGTLKFGQQTVEISSQRKTYEIAVPYKRFIEFMADGGTVSIESYSTQKEESVHEK